jgi:enoyl-[acyl-carrier protein] reductase II
LDAVTVPVVAVGGIATARGVTAVLVAGADGARVGTRFIAAAESDAHPAWVDAVIAARAEEAVVSTMFNAGRRSRVRTACCARRSRPPRRSPTAKWA